ncbi:MAG: hypothetical protein R2794_12790 [Chitinophagales bacterium]
MRTLLLLACCTLYFISNALAQNDSAFQQQPINPFYYDTTPAKVVFVSAGFENGNLLTYSQQALAQLCRQSGIADIPDEQYNITRPLFTPKYSFTLDLSYLQPVFSDKSGTDKYALRFGICLQNREYVSALSKELGGKQFVLNGDGYPYPLSDLSNSEFVDTYQFHYVQDQIGIQCALLRSKSLVYYGVGMGYFINRTSEMTIQHANGLIFDNWYHFTEPAANALSLLETTFEDTYFMQNSTFNIFCPVGIGYNTWKGKNGNPKLYVEMHMEPGITINTFHALPDMYTFNLPIFAGFGYVL